MLCVFYIDKDIFLFIIPFHYAVLIHRNKYQRYTSFKNCHRITTLAMVAQKDLRQSSELKKTDNHLKDGCR